MKTMNKATKSILALVCIAVVCAIAIPAIIAEFVSEDFVTVNTITQTTTLGSNATYLIAIKNSGTETDTVSLAAINMDNASVAVLSQTEMILDPGQSGDVILNVTDDLVMGPYRVLVNATSQTTGIADEVETITAVIEEEEEE
jgi:hypothetical protein